MRSFRRSSESQRSTLARPSWTRTSRRKACLSRPEIRRTTSCSPPTTSWTRTSRAGSKMRHHLQVRPALIYSSRKLFLKKWAIPGLFLFIFVFSTQLTIKIVQLKLCQWLDSNRGPLVLEATALPTEPQSVMSIFYKQFTITIYDSRVVLGTYLEICHE